MRARRAESPAGGGRGRRRNGATIALAALPFSGCASDAEVVCVSNDTTRVCAEADGSIEFSGRGLAPGSDVVIDHEDLGEAVYVVRSDGTFEPGGRGVLSYFGGTELTFTVTATDADGTTLDGSIVIAS